MGNAMDDMSLDLAALTLNELSSPAARVLLDTIDSLREIHVDDIVDLPQIIVVGDQSSGKSSVLEAISRVRFPTKGDVCTRFATELVVRQAPETKIAVRIEPGGPGSPQQFSRNSFDKDALPEIIREATEKMGIFSGGKKSFSKDILHVEISSPDVYPVTLVDLPGFFHSETSDQDREGKEIARALAERYMEQEKSLILAVVAADNNLANQIVVEEAKKFDPSRERTLGVITRPDRAAPGSGNEEKCLQLLQGKERKHKLKLGWHVLRNRSEGEEGLSADDRDANEKSFFRTGAWSRVNSDCLGIATLRQKLSTVLLEHIRKTLPDLIEEIERNLSARQQKLEALGRPRSDANDLRIYLTDIAGKFQHLVHDGMHGRYDDKFFGSLYDDRDTRKLRASLRRLKSAFHATLILKGIDREIVDEDGEDDMRLDGGFSWIRDGDVAPDYLESFLDLFDKFPKPTRISKDDLCEELEEWAAANQGNEFPGLPNGNLGFQFFRMQAEPWGGIAEVYLDQVVNLARCFVEELFMHIIGVDVETADAVLKLCVAAFFEEKQIALKEKLQEILRPYVSKYGPPLDTEFHVLLSSRKVRREASRVASLLEENFPTAFTDKGGKGLTREQVEQAISSEQNERDGEFGTEDVIEMAMTHFQISLRTFAENVINLAVENCLVSELPTILTPSMVIRMSEERLRELASESEKVQEEREKLQNEIQILGEGLTRCRSSRPHVRTVFPGAFMNGQYSTMGR